MSLAYLPPRATRKRRQIHSDPLAHAKRRLEELAKIQPTAKGHYSDMNDESIQITKAEATLAWETGLREYAAQRHVSVEAAVMPFTDTQLGKRLYGQLRDVEKRGDEIRKDAIAKGHGRTLDELAAFEKRPNESIEQAYDRVLQTPEGRETYKAMKAAMYAKRNPEAIERFEKSVAATAVREGLDHDAAKRVAARTNASAYASYVMAGGEPVSE